MQDQRPRVLFVTEKQETKTTFSCTNYLQATRGGSRKFRKKGAEEIVARALPSQIPTPPPFQPQTKIQVRGSVAYSILGTFVTKGNRFENKKRVAW